VTRFPLQRRGTIRTNIMFIKGKRSEVEEKEHHEGRERAEVRSQELDTTHLPSTKNQKESS